MTTLKKQLSEQLKDGFAAKINVKLRSKEYNLVLHGIKMATNHETALQSQEVVTSFLQKELRMDTKFIDKLEIAHAHRLLRRTRNSDKTPPPIVVKFLKMKQKQTILERSVDARKLNVGISQHLPVIMQHQRQALLKTVNKL